MKCNGYGDGNGDGNGDGDGDGDGKNPAVAGVHVQLQNEGLPSLVAASITPHF